MQDSTETSASSRRGAAWAAGLAAAGVLVATVALARDVFDWRAGSGTPAATSPAAGAGPANPSPAGPESVGPETGTPPPTNASGSVRLDTLAVEAGAANLVKLPRQLAGQPQYDRPIVIGCPSNSGADKQRDVTFRLHRRYLDLTSTVRPFFPSPDERAGVVHVYAQVATRQTDGTITRVTRGQQFDARMDTPRDLVADVEGADELTLRVQCQYPGGSVVFTAAAVSEG